MKTTTHLTLLVTLLVSLAAYTSCSSSDASEIKDYYNQTSSFFIENGEAVDSLVITASLWSKKDGDYQKMDGESRIMETYDEQNRIIGRIAIQPNSLMKNKFEYDEQGLLSKSEVYSKVNDAENVSTTYVSLVENNKIQVETKNEEGKITSTSGYTIDPKKRTAKIQWLGDSYVLQEFNEQKRIVNSKRYSIEGPDNDSITFETKSEYDINNRLIKESQMGEEINLTAVYDYTQIDDRGNWTQAKISSNMDTIRITLDRTIYYRK